MFDDLLIALLAILLMLGGCEANDGGGDDDSSDDDDSGQEDDDDDDSSGNDDDDDDTTPDPDDLDGDGVTVGDGDCYDDNPDVYPGQTAAFDVDRGDGSYDYDCDGVEQASALEFRDPTCDVSACLGREPGWLEAGGSISWDPCPDCVPLGTLPGCGEEGWWDGGYCQLDTGEFGEPVACHGPDPNDIYPVSQSCL